jgi:glycosyltransferase involved in cell wall biosynthesis
VITRANNRGAIETAIAKMDCPDLHFVYYDLPSWMKSWKSGPRRMHLYYFLWQIGIWKIARKLNAQHKFHIVHHITFGSLFLPTFLPMLPTPFVWGPLGGAEQVSKEFRRTWTALPRLKERLRDLLIRTLRFNPLFLLACKRAVLILCKTEDTAQHIPAPYAKKVVVTTDVGVHQPVVTESRHDDSILQLFLAGSLDAWRGFDLAIRAFGLIAAGFQGMRLIIVGAGVEKMRLAELSLCLGLEDRVVFMGKVAQEKYTEFLMSSDIVLNPCLKEGGVTVLFDALLWGKPVVCLDVGGSSQIVNETCGIRVELTSPENTVRHLADAIEMLASDQSLREQMGKAGRELVQKYHSWEKKGEFVRQEYARLVSAAT